MQDDLGARIAARATCHIGAPFRLHGRSMDGGFDCVGLAADALSHVGFVSAVPADYTLRGEYEGQLCRFFDHDAFAAVSLVVAGDFLAVRTAPRQLHLLIAVGGGFVHAHAGLRRVVLTPHPVPWPLLGHWRCVFR